MGGLALPGPPRDARRSSGGSGARTRKRGRRRAHAIRFAAGRPPGRTREVDTRSGDAVGDGRPERRPRPDSVPDDHGRPGAARERDPHRRGEGRRRRLARRAERTRAHADARRLRRLVLGRDRRRGKRLDRGPRPGRRGAGRDHGSLRPRPHRLAAGHDRRPAGEHRCRAASDSLAPRADRARHRPARVGDARRRDAGTSRGAPEEPQGGPPRRPPVPRRTARGGTHVDHPAHGRDARRARRCRPTVEDRPCHRRGAERPRLGRRRRARHRDRARAVRARRLRRVAGPPRSIAGRRRKGCSRPRTSRRASRPAPPRRP